MQSLYDVLVWVHIACWVLALVGYAITLPAARVNGLLAHGLTAAFLLGIVLVGIASGSDDVSDPNNAKAAVKLLVAFLAVGLAHSTRRRPAPNPLAHVVAGLILVNVVIAYAW
ncbi:hypothetical protein ASD11_03960 [Aeromicrobium sp. Root495]|uniref:hypothetical protein n=1 Tax=Aeromicrobium sp. Root495 TaxID=1736550 RepID=UPI0006FB69DA|nr:hypothetical protein [Aeromicrobium sp. Root495]KQY58797.1 hypothetical protein ASD11_03960 [Aeromicrobium sp. Root495]